MNLHTKTIYDDVLVYELAHQRVLADIDFYKKLAKRYPGPVLELGCGAGRVTVPLAEEVDDITGIDILEPMLNRAKENADAKGLRINWVRGDIRDFDLGRQFSLIIYPMNSICHMHDLRSLEACFTQARKHLAPEGRFVLHMYNPGLQILVRDPSQRYPVAEYEDPHGRGHVVVTENNIYDRASQVNQIKWYYKYQETGEESVIDLPMRVFYPQELDALLHYNAFEIEHKYGGYDMSEFTSDSACQIPVCRRR